MPHPDDIIIDMKTGCVRINGPFTKEDKAIWDRMRARKAECDGIIAEHQETLRDEPDCKYASVLHDEICHERRIREIIARVIKD